MCLVVKLVAEDASDTIANGERSPLISHTQNGGVGSVSSSVGDGKSGTFICCFWILLLLPLLLLDFASAAAAAAAIFCCYC